MTNVKTQQTQIEETIYTTLDAETLARVQAASRRAARRSRQEPARAT